MIAAAESAPTAAPAPAARSHSFARSPISGGRCLKPSNYLRLSSKKLELRGRLSARPTTICCRNDGTRVGGGFVGLLLDEI
jgi:hypothetical protein